MSEENLKNHYYSERFYIPKKDGKKFKRWRKYKQQNKQD